MMMKKQMLFLALIVLLCSCKEKVKPSNLFTLNEKFNSQSLTIQSPALHQSKGQVLYVPVYSNIPVNNQKSMYNNISTVLAIHNTDFQSPIYITCVNYLNTKGMMVAKFLSQRVTVMPMETKDFFIPEKDTSGAGANFIVEWVCDSTVSTPKIETVMIGVSSSNSVSFISEATVLREKQ